MAQLSWDNKRNLLIIPVFDAQGRYLFNKYRKDPDLKTDGPKYLYDKGSGVALFNAQYLKHATTAVICEGELDALALLAKGYYAFTSTGGCDSFQAEWAPWFLDKSVYICFDSDEPGIEGAFRVQQMIPHAKMIFLPKEIKDICEYFGTHKKTHLDFKNLCINAETYRVPAPVKAEKQAVIREANESLDAYGKEIQNKVSDAKQEVNGQYQHLEILSKIIDKCISQNNQNLKKLKSRSVLEGENIDRVAEAKKVPIDRFVEFVNYKAHCLWHVERTPSMHYYPRSNSVYCFGCSEGGDVIDVVQKVKNLDFKEALDLLCPEKPTNKPI